MLTLLLLLAADDPGPALAKLAELGLKPTAGVAVAAEETDFAKGMTAFIKINRDLATAVKEHATFEQKLAHAKAELVDQKQLLRNLRLEYNAAPSNNLVNRINLVIEDINAKEALIRDENTGKDVRAKLSKARETYLERIAEVRKSAEAAKAKYEALAKDEAIAAAVAAAKEATGKPLVLGPSKQFERSLTALEKLEAKTNTDEIALRKEGNTFRVDVLLNGSTATSMVFDTGASSVSLPWELAKSAGLTPNDSTPQVTVTIADGRSFPAYRMELESVKLGKFVARNVECIVMPRDHSDAPALLGGAFLNRFNYKMDQGTGKLRMTQLGEESDGVPAKTKAPKKNAKKKA